MTVKDFKIGDRVQNRAAHGKPIGVVIALEYQNEPHVVVEFPPTTSMKKREPWCGAYDDVWLKANELRKITST